MNVSPMPRQVRSAPPPLANYFYVGRNDHTTVLQLLAQGQKSFHGIIVDATRVARHRELLREAADARLECILDPCTLAAGTVGGHTDRIGALPWAKDRPHILADFQGRASNQVISSLAEFAVEHDVSQVFAPTHCVRTSNDSWLTVDIENAHRLRERLNANNGKAVDVIYQLCIPYAVLRDEEQRAQLVRRLAGVPAVSLWLRIDGCGRDSTSTAVRNYIAACHEFGDLGLPLVADHIGGLTGLSLLALSAVGGLATGLGIGERFSASHWHRPRAGHGYMPHPGVYIPALDLSLAPADAKALFERNLRLKGLFGCKDHDCCARGVIDMIEKPARHFMIQRVKEVGELSQQPASLRANLFLDARVRPATDYVLRLSRAQGLDERMQKRLERHRHRLDSLRLTLRDLIDSGEGPAEAKIPKPRATRENSIVTQRPI